VVLQPGCHTTRKMNQKPSRENSEGVPLLSAGLVGSSGSVSLTGRRGSSWRDVSAKARMPGWECRQRHLPQMCVWGCVTLTVPYFWAALQARLTIAERGQIAKVCREVQLDKRIRFDVFCTRESVIPRVARVAMHCGWRARAHLSYMERLAIKQARTGTVQSCPAFWEDRVPRTPRIFDSLRVLTWNVRSLTQKKGNVELFVDDVQADVVAIQETWRSGSGWALSMPGYRVIEQPAPAGGVSAGKLGLALAVRKAFSVITVGSPDANFILAKVSGGKDGASFIVGSVYLPCASTKMRNPVWKRLTQELACVRKKYSNLPVILGGDWNCEPGALPVALRALDLNPVLSDNRRATRYNGKKAVDNVLVSGSLRGSAAAKVYTGQDVSDHWPVVVTVHIPVGVDHDGWQVPRRRSKFNVALLNKKEVREIATSNRWAALYGLGEDGFGNPRPVAESTAEVWERFNSVSNEVQQDTLRHHGVNAHHHKRGCISRRVKNMLHQRRKLYQAVQHAKRENHPQVEQVKLMNDFLVAKSSSQEALLAERKDRWYSYIARFMQDLGTAKGGAKRYWQALKTLLGRARKSSVVPVVSPETKELIAEPGKIASLWEKHYQGLYSDVTGHSQDESAWDTCPVSRPRNSQIVFSECDDLNKPLLWKEIRECVRNLAYGTAPGPDGLTSDWFKLVGTKPPSEGTPDEPQNRFGWALKKVLDVAWDRAEVPEEVNVAEVVSIPKKGDPSLMDNYRGISLINVCLKILTSAATARLSAYIERNQLLSRSQAGFRPYEECIAQTTALYEICRRRQIKGQKTWLIFVDVKKAYDSVPHAALLRKLAAMGVHGRFYEFFRSLYKTSKFVVAGSTGSCSREDAWKRACRILRGVRQGCTSSPLLFDVFVDDILHEGEAWAVPIPCSEKGVELSCPGLLFADDLVIAAGSESDADAAIKAIERWAERWEMTYGAAKCGSMVIDGSPEEKAHQFMIQGENIPIVKEYMHLGTLFKDDLSLDAMAEKRVESLRKALYSCEHVLRNRSIPLRPKIHIVKAMILSTFLFGSELWGMNSVRVAKAQTLVNEALRWCLGMSTRSTQAAINNLSTELGVPSLNALADARRARLLHKAPTLKTFLRKLVKHPLKTQLKTWVTGSSLWLERMKVSRYTETGKLAPPAEIASRVKQHAASREAQLACKKAKSVALYRASKFHLAGKWFRFAESTQTLVHGTIRVARFRIGAVWTGGAAAKAGVIPPVFTHRCPICHKNCYGGESKLHILLYCKAYEEMRQRLIWPIYSKINEFRVSSGKVVVSREELYVLLLGGEIHGGEFLWRAFTREAPQRVMSILGECNVRAEATKQSRLEMVNSWAEADSSERKTTDEDGSNNARIIGGHHLQAVCEFLELAMTKRWKLWVRAFPDQIKHAGLGDSPLNQGASVTG
jgi:hypothetical protein